MAQITASAKGLVKRIRTLLYMAALCVPVPALAQSAYGCSGLAGARLPSVEGTQGVFFRIDPDMMMFHHLSDNSIEQIGDLSRILAERGTILIVLPIPIKSLVMDDLLGQEAEQRGFDPAIASLIHAQIQTRLKAAGVLTVDAMNALQDLNGEEPPFFHADRRLTNPGLLALARATARRIGAEVPVRIQAQSDITVASMDRLSLQAKCLLPIPELTTRALVAVATESSGGTITVASTELTGDPELGFAGYLSAMTGHEVNQVMVPQDSVAALSSVLTSAQFPQNRPDFLVWELPIWSNPARPGDQPLREVTAAALDVCGLPTETETLAPGRFRIALPEFDRPADYDVFVDTGARDVTRVDFHFTSASGQVRTRSIVRHAGQPLTGRFFMPMTGLWANGADSVEIVTHPAQERLAAVATCRGLHR